MIRSRLSFARGLIVASTLALMGLASCPAQAQFVFTNFQSFDPPFADTTNNPYAFVSGAVGISNNGTIVGVYTDTDNTLALPDYDASQRAYIFQNGVFTSVSHPAQAGSVYDLTALFSINTAGVSTGVYNDFDFANPNADPIQTYFIRSSAGVFTTPTVTPTPNGTISGLYGINDAGLVATQYTEGGLIHAALYDTNTNTFTLLLPDVVVGGNTYIQTISNNGVIVGNYDDGSAKALAQPFIYRNGAYTNISYNAPGAIATRFNGINAAGIVSGRYLVDSGTVDANNDPIYLSHGLLYNSNNGFFTPFDFPGANQTSLALGSINDANQITGNYDDENNLTHSFTVTAVGAPEPSALALLTTGGSLLGSTVLVRRRRHMKSGKTVA